MPSLQIRKAYPSALVITDFPIINVVWIGTDLITKKESWQGSSLKPALLNDRSPVHTMTTSGNAHSPRSGCGHVPWWGQTRAPLHTQSPWGDSTLVTAGSALECGEAEKCTSVLTTKDKQPIRTAQSKRRADRQHNVAEVFGTEYACRGLHLQSHKSNLENY